MKTNLSPTANGTQYCDIGAFQSGPSPFAQFMLARTKSGRTPRMPLPVISARSILRGNRHYLRALRTAEMAAWQAGHPLTVNPLFTFR